MARAYGSRSQLAGAFETIYGTAPASGFFNLPFSQADLGMEQPLLESDLLGAGRDPLAPSLDAISAGGGVTIPMDREALGFWLKMAFGAPTTTGTSNKTHTFKTGGLTLPSASIEVAMPEIPRFAMYSGCVLDEIGFGMQHSGQLTGNVKLAAQGENVEAATAAGTPTTFAMQRFGNFNGSIKRGGVVLGNVVSADVTYKNNLDMIETIRNDGKIDGADPTVASMTGKLDLRFADNILMDDAINGTPISLELALTISANVSLTITAHEVYLPVPKVPITGPKGIQASFDWQAAKNSVAGQMATIVLKNQIASY